MAQTTNDHGPKYYRRGTIQVWDFIRDQELNFHLGNVIKYVCRAGHKEDQINDLTKAIHYLTNELEHVTNNYTRNTPDILEQSSEGIQDDILHWELNRSGTAD